MSKISRLAPTPSGYLHLGNIVNFIKIWSEVRRSKGKIWLRIDDADAGRERPEFVDDIFITLEWLGFDWDEGPRNPRDFYENFSQQKRTEHYREVLKKLNTFACECSRKQIAEASSDGLYPGTCRDKSLSPEGRNLRIPSETPLGDFVVWRKDDLPSYQLASLVDDVDYGINYIVRGADLVESSEAQCFLAEQLGFQSFLDIDFVHHTLITDEKGGKLSKSDEAWSIKNMRESGAKPEDVFLKISRDLGLGECKTLQEFVSD